MLKEFDDFFAQGPADFATDFTFLEHRFTVFLVERGPLSYGAVVSSKAF
jgi:hypothetical protein